jgi:hypothetical protein
MEIIPIQDLKENPNNPRKIDQVKLEKLVKSILEFPEMLDKRPLVIDENNIVLGGNMRLKALSIAGISEVPVIYAVGWSDDQKRQFLIKDNLSYGEWDYDIINSEFDISELGDWGMDFPSFLTEESQSSELIQLSEQKEDLKAFKKVHVLLSFPPESLTLISDLLEQIRKTQTIEYEQSAN